MSTAAVSSALPSWDPYDAVVDEDPYPVWAALREKAPVYRNDRYDFWALSRYADVEAAHRDPLTYSSASGTVLERMGPDQSSPGLMIFMDPPEHTRLRSLVSRALTPRRVAALEGAVRRICAQLLDQQVGRGGFDFVADFAAQVPSRVISSLVGVPAEDQERQRRLVEGMFHIEEDVGMLNPSAAASAMELGRYLAGLIAQRGAAPADDMISDLARAEIVDEDGGRRRLNLEECTRFAILLYSAGTETVAKLLGNAGVVLARHPEQRRDLVAHPELIPNAVAELLRFEPPSPVQGRTTTVPVTLHGVSIPAGAKVLLLTGSAGRDERVYPDPDRFDARRVMASHLSFGYGVHFCLGASLARLEGRIALEEVLRRFPTWEVDSDGLERVHTSTVRGYRSVPVRI